MGDFPISSSVARNEKASRPELSAMELLIVIKLSTKFECLRFSFKAQKLDDLIAQSENLSYRNELHSFVCLESSKAPIGFLFQISTVVRLYDIPESLTERIET